MRYQAALRPDFSDCIAGAANPAPRTRPTHQAISPLPRTPPILNRVSPAWHLTRNCEVVLCLIAEVSMKIKDLSGWPPEPGGAFENLESWPASGQAILKQVLDAHHNWVA